MSSSCTSTRGESQPERDRPQSSTCQPCGAGKKSGFMFPFVRSLRRICMNV